MNADEINRLVRSHMIRSVIKMEKEEPEEDEPTCEEDDCDNPIPDGGTPVLYPMTRSGEQIPRHLCGRCVSNYTYECARCDQQHHMSNMTEGNTWRTGRNGRFGDLCDDCVNDSDVSRDPCSDCGSYYERGEDVRLANRNRVCNYCLRDGEYYSCDSCNEYSHGNDMYSDERLGGSNMYCRDCFDDLINNLPKEEQDSDLINEYGYDPPEFNMHHDEGDESRHYGVELETILKHGDLHDAAKGTLALLNEGETQAEGFAYLKEDSSLKKEVQREGYSGAFEIVTHPATLPIQKKKWEHFLDNRPKGLISKNAKSTGLHIHVERKQLGDLAIGKILAFVNSLQNKDFITAIARRESERYASLKPDKRVTDVKYKGDRYEAVNLANDKTIEFRIFKGTMDKKEFMESLEFADALTSYVTNELPAVREMMGKTGISGLARFVMRNRKTYPYFSQFIAEWIKNDPELSKESPEKMQKGKAIRHVPMQVGISFAIPHEDVPKPHESMMNLIIKRLNKGK